MTAAQDDTARMASIMWPLVIVARNTSGPVLELGVGDYSTPLLHALCKGAGRDLVSYDGDPGWGARYGARIAENWDAIPIERPWGLAIVDHAPYYRRIIDARRLAPWAEVTFIHDTEAECYGWSRLWREFDWVYHCQRHELWSTVAGRGAPPPWVARELVPGQFLGRYR